MTVSRRQFCASVGAATVAASAFPVVAAESGRTSLRVIAYNVYVCRGWPSDRERAKTAVEKGQMAERLALELALYDPDIINFSESPSEEICREVAERLGMKFVRFPSGGNWPGTLLSRYEITASENAPLGVARPADLFTRHWGRGLIELPNGEALVVHSAHLHPVPDPTTRLREVRAMLKSMESDLDAGRSMLLIGDLNHEPDAEEYKLWTEAGWVDSFAKVGTGKGYTIKADTPARRIDYVMATGPIASRVVESRPLFEGAFRVNNDDKRSFALSDHLPQLAVFESAM